jgi:hypothetical protein
LAPFAFSARETNLFGTCQLYDFLRRERLGDDMALSTKNPDGSVTTTLPGGATLQTMHPGHIDLGIPVWLMWTMALGAIGGGIYFAKKKMR